MNPNGVCGDVSQSLHARASSERAAAPCTPFPSTDGRRDDDFFRLTGPMVAEFGAELEASGLVLSFFDADGWMRWIGGSPRNADRLAKMGFRPGERCHYPAGPTAVPERSALEVISHRRWRCAEGWVSAVAAVRGACSPEPTAFVKVAAPPPLTIRDVAAARTIARAIHERLRSAITVREHIVEYALDVAGEAREAAFAVDAGGRVIGTTLAARHRLALDGRDVPAAVRERLAALLAGTGARNPGARRDLDIDWPGGPGRLKLRVSAIRYRDQAVGAIVRPVVEARRRAASARPHRAAAQARYAFGDILGESDAIRTAIALAQTAARNDLPVVLVGESGTGKELFAHAIHAAGARQTGPLVALNCGCIAASLLEAELFGYEPGTFTGGRSEGKAGKFEEADGGTLLLDEVSELSPQAQAALLRVLQEREVVRLGGSSPRRVDVRVVAASNKSLSDEIAAGRFRSDLYFRLNVLAIAVPPLRERSGDVTLLAEAFLRDAEAQVDRGGLAFSPDALAALEAYDWPGNVRELRNVILRTAAIAPGAVIEVADLPEELRPGAAGARAAIGSSDHAAAVGEPFSDREGLLRALASTASWNVAHAAAALHVSRTTLYRWLRKYQIER